MQNVICGFHHIYDEFLESNNNKNKNYEDEILFFFFVLNVIY
jgi:hypothetical protein